MENTLKISDRQIRFYRRLRKNHVFSELVGFFADAAESTGLRKGHIASALDCEPSQVSRWLAKPTNLTLDTISDLLLAMNAEMDFKVVPANNEQVTQDEFMAAFSDWAKNREYITVTEIDGIVPVDASLIEPATSRDHQKAVNWA